MQDALAIVPAHLFYFWNMFFNVQSDLCIFQLIDAPKMDIFTP